jgi:hypothetical protein
LQRGEERVAQPAPLRDGLGHQRLQVAARQRVEQCRLGRAPAPALQRLAQVEHRVADGHADAPVLARPAQARPGQVLQREVALLRIGRGHPALRRRVVREVQRPAHSAASFRPDQQRA